MYILTPENTSYDMNNMPNVLSKEDNDVYYMVLDYSDQQNVDFTAIPLVFLDLFPRPAAQVKFTTNAGRKNEKNYLVSMPLDWSIVISDVNFGYTEIIELKHLNDRDFSAFVLNPISSYLPSFPEIVIESVFSQIDWCLPRLKYGHILAVPLEEGPKPLCAFFVKDTNKLPESLDLTKIFA